MIGPGSNLDSATFSGMVHADGLEEDVVCLIAFRHNSAGVDQNLGIDVSIPAGVAVVGASQYLSASCHQSIHFPAASQIPVVLPRPPLDTERTG